MPVIRGTSIQAVIGSRKLHNFTLIYNLLQFLIHFAATKCEA